jgi:hypothetical protein
MTAHATERFDPAMLDALAEPVRRYFLHALAPGAVLGTGTRLSMIGRIDVGVWLPFRAVWEGDARSFCWAATSGPFGLPLLRVVDQFAAGSGSTDIRLRGGLQLLHAANADTTRSGAGRAAAEAMWTPASLLPARGVRWHAESDELIVAGWDVPPERPVLRLWIDDGGAVRAAAVNRWDDGRHGRHGYIPCGGEVLADRRFGDITIPERISVGWWYGAPRYKPFFEATITGAEPTLG